MEDREDRQRPVEEGGFEFVLQYFFKERFADASSKEATRRVLIELFIFYCLILVGFGLLWFTYRSNQRLRQWRATLQRTVSQQRGREFEPGDAAKLYGMF